MVATFHLHCLWHRIKYGNPEVEDATTTMLSLLNHFYFEFIESFLFWVILFIYNIGIYISRYIHKLSYIHYFFVIFNCYVFNCYLQRHIKHFDVWKNILWNWWVDYSTIHQVMWYFWDFIVNPFSLLWIPFFFKKSMFALVSLSLAYRWGNQPKYFW